MSDPLVGPNDRFGGIGRTGKPRTARGARDVLAAPLASVLKRAARAVWVGVVLALVSLAVLPARGAQLAEPGRSDRETGSADPDTIRTFEWGRIQSRADWLLPLVVVGALVFYSRWVYRREQAELPVWLVRLLTTLRLGTWATLLLVYLEPQWRVSRQVNTQSQVVVLVDTSLSMGLSDGASPSVPQGPTRAEQVAEALEQSDLLAQLRARQDVVIARFDEDCQRLTTLRKTDEAGAAAAEGEPQGEDRRSLDWPNWLAARGAETRLGQALLQTLEDHRGAPLAGVVLLTDGAQNAGTGLAAAAQQAAAADVPILPIGFGSPDRPRNLRVRDLAGPARTAPDDNFQITGFIESDGATSEPVTVELSSHPATEADSQGGPASGARLEGTLAVTLAQASGAVPVAFTVSPDEVGVRTYRLRVVVPQGDANPQDDSQQIDVEVIERPTEVLLVSGGPSREYQFVRNLLNRDAQMAVDVYLQTAADGVAQEGRNVLAEFPNTREQLWNYDVVLAFDPDWRAVGPTGTELLERWVAEQAGGLLCVAGRVATERWAADAALEGVRRLYPLEFARRLAVLDDEEDASDEPWPVELTREGEAAEFLRLLDDPRESREAWARFAGVFECYEAGQIKPGATIYARQARPGGEADARPLVVGQFYGAGRVLYLGGGEFWRLRRLDEAYFERLYTQMVRYLSQGRLLRGSTHGVLLVERDRYTLGETATIVAQLKNPQLQPLAADSVVVDVLGPDGQLAQVRLVASPEQPGTYRGQLPLRREGSYRLELVVPESPAERLTRRLLAQVPDLERTRPERHDAELAELARATRGIYYRGMSEALGLSGGRPVWEQIADRSQTVLLSGAPIPLWDNAYVMALGCGLLALEWLLRRLAQLA